MPYSFTRVANGQTIQAADVDNQQVAAETISAGVYNVKEAAYGAKGDGTTDDTAAIQAALTACSTAGGGTVYLPPGVYIVTPVGSTTWLKVGSNTWVKGAGRGASIVRVKSNAGNYETVFSDATLGTSVSNVTYSDFTLDQQAASNTTGDVQSITGQNQIAIEHNVGSNIAVLRIVFDTCCGVQTVMCDNGGNGSLNGVVVRDCTFHFVRAHTTVPATGLYDNSTVYLDGFDQRVSGNRFTGSPGTDHPFTAMELHGGPSACSWNTTDGYETALNIVSDQNTARSGTYGGDNGFAIVGNTFFRANAAIQLWALNSQTLRDVVIAGNTIGLSQVEHNAAYCQGIVFTESSGTGTFDHISVVGNTILFVYEGVSGRITSRNSSGYSQAYICGIGIQPPGPVTNVLIANNLIKLAPTKGISLMPTAGLTNVRILNNVVVDAGQNAAVGTGLNRAAIWAASAAATTWTDVEIAGNRVYDDGASAPYGDQSFYLHGAGTHVRCAARANSVQTVAGTLANSTDGTLWGRDYGSATIAPGAITAGGEASATITVKGAVVGDMIDVVPATTLEAGLVFTAWISAADTATVRIHNASAGSVTPASRTWYAYLTKQPF